MKNRVLMFHPTHRTAVNSIAGLFPEISFDLALVPERPADPREVLCVDESLQPLEGNVRILDKSWREVDELAYDLYISYPGMVWIARRAWRIPGVMMFLNAEDPFVRGYGWYIANTWSTFERLPAIANKSLIFPTVGQRATGDWVGDYAGAYFLNERNFRERQGLFWDRSFLDFLSLRVPFARTDDFVPWDEYMAYRRRMRVYIELSSRKISCTLLESMMMGQPVIAPDSEDWNRIVEDGKSGLLYGSRDEAADMVLSVIEDDGFAKRLGDQGRIRAEWLAGDEVRRAEWLKIFKEVTV